MKESFPRLPSQTASELLVRCCRGRVAYTNYIAERDCETSKKIDDNGHISSINGK
jgi:hypothetical protein